MDDPHYVIGSAALRPRLRLLAAVFVALILFLLGRLWVVQVRHGDRHSERLSHQNIRRIRLNPVRGRMFAADGASLLADTRPSYDLVFHVSEMRQPGPRSKTLNHIAEKAAEFGRLIGRASPFDDEGPKRHLVVYPALPLTVYSHLSPREMALIAEQIPLAPAAEIRPSSRRHYPLPGVATHVLGFAGRRPPPDQSERDRYSYVLPELHGRAGLEKQYDEALTGTPGMRVVRVDTLGFAHKQIGDPIPAVPGNDLVLTLDHRLQQIADRLIADKEGAIVVVNVNTGGVLAMASAPSYDLSRLDADLYGRLAGDEENRPLINRAANGAFLPGSIVKPLIGIAAVETGTASAEELVVCSGAVHIGNASIGCWYEAGHGPLDLRGALEQSCNVYFIRKGMATGLDRLRPFLLAAGFGAPPKIDLPSSAAGLVPSRSWAYRHWGRGWLAIDTAFLSIGQGAVSTSPLQTALYAAAIANGGTVFRPFLVQEIRSPDGKPRHRTLPDPVGTLPVSRRTLDIVRDGMERVVHGADATAPRARNSAISLAGKTGTAEVGPPDERSHNTWFVCYGPLEAPRYAAAILVRNGVSGGRTAAPIAARLFEAWLGAR